MTARVTPSRATSREPTNAAAANRMIGRPVSMPISVPERLNSLAQYRNDRRDREKRHPQCVTDKPEKSKRRQG